MSVLIVDDEPEIRSTLQRVLTGTVRTVNSLRDGIVAALDWHPDVVLLDVHFSGSGESGIDALPKIKAVSPSSAVIVMTANYREEDGRAALSRGAFGYSSKADLALIRVLVLAARALGVRVSGPSQEEQQ